MSTEDLLGRVANTAILAGMSLEMIKLVYPKKVYEREKSRRSRKRADTWAKKQKANKRSCRRK